MSCDSYDCDYPKFSELTVRTARKDHRCSACGELSIRRGDRYELATQLFDGEWLRDKRCARCRAIYDHLLERMRREGDPGEFPDWVLGCGDDYRERWNEDPPPEIAALAFALAGEVQ